MFSLGFLRRWLFPILLMVAGLAVYQSTIRTPFVFDDGLAVRENPSIRSLGNIGAVLSPPADGSGASGRPLVNLSLAVNYALGGLNPTGYHVFNLLCHCVAGLLFFAVLRRMFLLPRFQLIFGTAPAGSRRLARANSQRPQSDRVAEQLAFLATLLWVLHPLQTESVVSVIQRTELMVAVCFLASLYGFFRSCSSSRPQGWQTVAILASFAGMATKEIMLSAPLVVLLFDRALIGGSFATAFKQRRTLYLGMAASWLLLAWLVIKMGGTRGGGAGFGTGNITWWSYFLKQWEAIIQYLWLSVWPNPLVLDYGTDVIWQVSEVAGRGAILVLLGVVTVWGIVRNSLWALVGAWFFLILGPSSSVMPLAAQTMAEHRMYLPLAALCAGAVVGAYRVLGRRLWLGVAAVALGFLTVTIARIADYSNELRLWEDTIAKRPRNERAYHNLAGVMGNLGRQDEAMRCYQRALEIQPLYVGPRIGLANCLFRFGRVEEAIREYRVAVQLDPKSIEALGNLGVVLCEAGQAEEGFALLQRALAMNPDFADAHFNMATVLLRSGQPQPAEVHFRHAIRLRADYAEAYNNLGAALLRQDRTREAEENFRAALRYKKHYPEAQQNLDTILREAPR